MSLERIRRRYNLDYKPTMRLIETKNDKAGKRYMFRLNDDAIFYSIAAAEFWKGANPEPVATPEPTPEPKPAPKPEPEYAMVRAENLLPGDIIARKQSPNGHMTVVSAKPSTIHGKTRLTYIGARGRRSADSYSGERFILHRRP